MQNQIDELSREVKAQKEQLYLQEEKIKHLNTKVSSVVKKKSEPTSTRNRFYNDNVYYHPKTGPNPTGMY